MTWHLSQKNEKVIQQLLPILKEAKKDVLLPTFAPDRLAYILRSGANTKFPELKRFQFRTGPNVVRCILNDLGLDLEAIIPCTEITHISEYYGLLQYLAENQITNKTVFKDCFLEEEERQRLLRFCVLKGYTPDFDHNQVTITKDV